MLLFLLPPLLTPLSAPPLGVVVPLLVLDVVERLVVALRNRLGTLKPELLPPAVGAWKAKGPDAISSSECVQVMESRLMTEGRTIRRMVFWRRTRVVTSSKR